MSGMWEMRRVDDERRGFRRGRSGCGGSIYKGYIVVTTLHCFSVIVSPRLCRHSLSDDAVLVEERYHLLTIRWHAIAI